MKRFILLALTTCTLLLFVSGCSMATQTSEDSSSNYSSSYDDSNYDSDYSSSYDNSDYDSDYSSSYDDDDYDYDSDYSSSYDDYDYDKGYGYTAPEPGESFSDYVKRQDPDLYNSMQETWDSLDD